MLRGRLIYLVGASGVGKDSVLAALRLALRVEDRVVVAHRYITRAPSPGGENHVALSDAEFAARLAAGCFSLDWESHGTRYGVGREIEVWLGGGLTVLVNGSRAHWPLARERFPDAQRVELTASEATLRLRLQARGRESGVELAERIARNRRLDGSGVPSDKRIANDGALAETVAELLDWLRHMQPQKTA